MNRFAVVRNPRNRPRGRTVRSGFALSLVFLSFVGCRLNYGADIEAESLSESVPNIEISGFRQQVYQDNRLVLEITAESSRAYQSRNLREMDAVEFIEYAADGTISSSGRADKAVLFTDTENVELTGSIEVYSQKEGASLIGDYFYWDSEGRRITSLLDDLIEIQTDDGEEIVGRGFSADMRRRRIEFTAGVEGVLDD